MCPPLVRPVFRRVRGATRGLLLGLCLRTVEAAADCLNPSSHLRPLIYCDVDPVRVRSQLSDPAIVPFRLPSKSARRAPRGGTNNGRHAGCT